MPKIKCSEIPKTEIKRICRTFCNAIIASTDDKDFVAKFEEQKNKEVDSLAHKKNAAYRAVSTGDSYTANGFDGE